MLRSSRLRLVLLCLCLWLPGFFTLPPGDRDESRFAQASKQMLETGDYVHIMNGAEPRLKKPIGIYWLQAPCAAAAHALHLAAAESIWPYRVPSLLGGILAVLACLALGRHLGFSEERASLAAAFMAASVILTVETHIAKTDAVLLATITVALACLARASFQTLPRAGAILFWVALGIGVLVKGPVAPMVIGLAAVTYGAWTKDWRWWPALRAKIGVPVLLVLVLPWFVAISISTHGAFFAQSVGGDLGKKLGGGEESHGGFPGEHLALLLALAFPASLWVARGLYLAVRDRHDRAVRFLIAVIAPNWLIFEAVPTKLPHYTLPLYPAIMLLAARGYQYAVPLPRPIDWLGYTGFIVTCLGLGLAASLLPPLALHTPVYVGLAALPAALLVLWLGMRQPWQAVIAAIALYAAVLGGALPYSAPLWLGRQLLAILPAHAPHAGDIIVAGYAEPSLRFLAGTDIIFDDSPDDAARELAAGHVTAAVIADRKQQMFLQDCAHRGLAVATHGEVSGFNYSTGHFVTLTVYVGQGTVSPPNAP